MSADPVRPVGVVHHGEDFHVRIFVLQERHHAVVHGQNGRSLHTSKYLLVWSSTP